MRLLRTLAVIYFLVAVFIGTYAIFDSGDAFTPMLVWTVIYWCGIALPIIALHSIITGKVIRSNRREEQEATSYARYIAYGVSSFLRCK